MSETTFTVELPDGSFQPCFSPSPVVRNYFTPGQEIPAAEFIRCSRAALAEACEHVRRVSVDAASDASTSLRDIERWAGALPPETPLVIVHIS
jgi:uncharacterized repeat protein (TIGR04042 family)